MDGSSNVTVLIWSFGQSSSHNQLDSRLTAHCCLISAHESLQSRDTAQGAHTPDRGQCDCLLPGGVLLRADIYRHPDISSYLDI